MAEAANSPGGDVCDLDRQLIQAEMTERLTGRARAPVRLGRFEVLARIGGGSMGAVYEVRDTKRGAHFALKTLLRSMRTQALRSNVNFARCRAFCTRTSS
jgi:hypothetical protein